MVIDTDGSAFVTKAEFDALKNSFQKQINNYNASIDSKIDGAIAAYLSGINASTVYELSNYYGDWEQTLGGKIKWVGTSASLDSYMDFQNKAIPWGLYCDVIALGQDRQYIVATPSGTVTALDWPASRNYTPYAQWASSYKFGIKVYTDTYICDRDGYVINYAKRFALNQKNNKLVWTSGYWTTYNYNVMSLQDGTVNKMGAYTWTFGETYKGTMAYLTVLKDSAAHIFNMDFVDWVVDYDTDDTENKGIILYPKRTTVGLDDCAWGTAVPVNGDDLRCAYMGMLGYNSLKSGAMTYSSSTGPYSSQIGYAISKWTQGAASMPTIKSRETALTYDKYIYDSTVDLTSTKWTSSGSGCVGYWVVPYWDESGKDEVYPVQRRMIKQRSKVSTVSTATYTFDEKNATGNICMFNLGYVYGSKLRYNIGSNLGSIKLRYPTDIVGSEVTLKNGIPITTTTKQGKVSVILNSSGAGTLYLNTSKVSDITTDTNSKSFTISSGDKTVVYPGDLDKDITLYMSFVPSGTSAAGYALTVNACTVEVES